MVAAYVKGVVAARLPALTMHCIDSVCVWCAYLYMSYTRVSHKEKKRPVRVR